VTCSPTGSTPRGNVFFWSTLQSRSAPQFEVDSLDDGPSLRRSEPGGGARRDGSAQPPRWRQLFDQNLHLGVMR